MRVCVCGRECAKRASLFRPKTTLALSQDQLVAVTVSRDRLQQELDERKFRDDHESGSKIVTEAQQLCASLQTQTSVLRAQVHRLRDKGPACVQDSGVQDKARARGVNSEGDAELLAHYQQQAYALQAELAETKAKLK